jgi:periplasmic protein TonB
LHRSSFALFVALLIHLIFLFIFWLLGTLAPEMPKPKPKENKIRISLKEMPVKAKESGLIDKKVKQTPIAPPMPKGSQLKEIVKPPPIKYEPKKHKPKKPKLNPKPKAKKTAPKIKPKTPKKEYIKLQKEEKKPDPLAWMKKDLSSQEVEKKDDRAKNGSSINQNIKELYGDEFGKLTPGQQKYILDNQEIMRRITQEILTRVARVNLPPDLNVNRINVIEFYLHPNGDMTDFHFLKKSGYFVLDNTTKETIEYAYSRYPRPKEKILIRYNVFYNLAIH